MKLYNSVCTTVYFPASRKDIEELNRMAHFLSEKDIDWIEFYYDGNDSGKIGSILSNTGLSGVYIGVIPSKEKKLHLCDQDEAGRTAAVQLFQDCMDNAQENGIAELMMNSGHIGKSVEKGLEALGGSVEELFNYAARKNYTMKLLMEPCDSVMDAFQLIGPYTRALEFTQSMHQKGLPLQLNMDTAHTVEEGESFLEALKAVKPYCNQIHFANCYIKDPTNPYYGDKHVGYEYPETKWMVPALSSLFVDLQKLYTGEEPLRIGLEVLCREEDPYAYFEKAWNSLKFLHKEGGEALK